MLYSVQEIFELQSLITFIIQEIVFTFLFPFTSKYSTLSYCFKLCAEHSFCSRQLAVYTVCGFIMKGTYSMSLLEVKQSNEINELDSENLTKLFFNDFRKERVIMTVIKLHVFL